MTDTLASKLIDEIERVSAKRERWREYRRQLESGPWYPGVQAVYAPAIFMMTSAIDVAKRALSDDDGVACIAALHDLQSYSNND